ncbi:MAG: DUF229 domain-containing protein [Candidatus Omnitrophota bacterium]|nr:MAG: DUF229 domain-containing protein [Candidatus Omnitrophota bacterium]
MAMIRRDFLKQTTYTASSLIVGNSYSRAADTMRPNIVWIIAEDLCPDLGCYGNTLVHTPNIDRLAGEGVRFTNAFTTAPVCSASRSAFNTGMYQTSIDVHHHRSHRQDGYRLPEDVHLITDYFRRAGYFTCNVKDVTPSVKGTQKTDYNFSVEKPFDGTDWNQRKEGQPFYVQINFPEAHRDFKRAKEHPVDPDKVDIPPYYPDHPLTRRDWADYLDTIGFLDEKVGAVLNRLENEGLAENTIVFFFGDHGRCHVRGKQWLYDEGIHIPLLVRRPGTLAAGSVRDDLISAIDLAPASLIIAGVEVPENMEGQDFLSSSAPKREFIIAARDRCDETVDRIRCVRTPRWKYIRNFMPNRPYSQLNRYKECQYPVLRLMRRLHEQGKLTPAQERFMAEARPMEELYDLQNDPHEIHNLAVSHEHAAVLKEMRMILDRWIVETGDQGEIPEDPAIAKQFEAEMMKLYDQKIKEHDRKENRE